MLDTLGPISSNDENSRLHPTQPSGFIHSDREPGLIQSFQVQNYLRRRGVVSWNSIPGRSNTNSRSELLVKRGLEIISCLLFQASAPITFWSDAALCAMVNSNLRNHIVPRINTTGYVPFGRQARAIVPHTKMHGKPRTVACAILAPDLTSSGGWKILYVDRDAVFRTTVVLARDVDLGNGYAWRNTGSHLREVLQLVLPPEELVDAPANEISIELGSARRIMWLFFFCTIAKDSFFCI